MWRRSIKKLWSLVFTMFAVSVGVYLIMEVNVDNVAVKYLGALSTTEQRELWLLENGYRDPLLERYIRWLGNFIRGDWGDSLRFRTAVFPLVMERLAKTALIAGLALLLIIPSAILLGTIAGMRSGSYTDRGISLLSIVSTSIPEFATATFLVLLFVHKLNWLPGTSSGFNGLQPSELLMPVIVLWLYSTGYLIRITRFSVQQTMNTPYIRTAIMKGVPYWRLTFRHVLRNAMIAPITVVFLLIPYMLSGVIVVELFFAYKGFGSLLLQAGLNDDIFLAEACALVTVVIVVITQQLSDLAYTLLIPQMKNPRIEQ